MDFIFSDGLTQLILQYTGSDDAQIRVTDKKEDNVLFDSAVGAGETFTFGGVDKYGTMGSEIRIYIGEDLDTKDPHELLETHRARVFQRGFRGLNRIQPRGRRIM